MPLQSYLIIWHIWKETIEFIEEGAREIEVSQGFALTGKVQSLWW